MTSLDLEIRRQLLAPRLSPQAVEAMWHSLEQSMASDPRCKERPMVQASNPTRSFSPGTYASPSRAQTWTKVLASLAAVLLLAVLALPLLPRILNQWGPPMRQVPPSAGQNGLIPATAGDKEKVKQEDQTAEPTESGAAEESPEPAEDGAKMDLMDPSLVLTPFYTPRDVQNLGTYASDRPDRLAYPLANLYWGPACRLPVYQNKLISQAQSPEAPAVQKTVPSLALTDEDMAEALQAYATQYQLEIGEVSYLPSPDVQAANRQAALNQGLDPDTNINLMTTGGVKTELAYAKTEDGLLAFSPNFYGGVIYHLLADPIAAPEDLDLPSLYRPANLKEEDLAQVSAWYLKSDPTILSQMASPQYVYSTDYNFVGTLSLTSFVFYDQSGNPNENAENFVLGSVTPVNDLNIGLGDEIDQIWPGYRERYMSMNNEEVQEVPRPRYFLGTSTLWQGSFEKIGDYPIISPEQAEDRFLQGQASYEKYSTYIPAEEAATLKVVGKELVYPHTYGLQYIQPYYRFIIQGEQINNVETKEPLTTPEGEPIYGYRFALVSALADEWVDWEAQIEPAGTWVASIDETQVAP
ncbi:MAG: hypothetical protein SPK23_05580 [Eubacteriales bacterium]|nr:hypothetical protein [Clostridiales bacterium]MDY5836570.1 hypothetical protein [Eubacteriales bacterium]